MELKIPKRLQKKGLVPQLSSKERVSDAPKGTKFVLFLGDEGAILVHIKDNAVQSRRFVPNASENNLEELSQTFSQDPRAPLVLVIDSMDQSFMQQTLPPVSAISVNKLIRRRLERDFAGNDIKGAILLGREKTGRRDWNFLMVALEKSPQLTVWLNYIQELPNRFLGVYLASVESELLVKNLERAIGVKPADEAEWKFFVSHNKVGGFRQVIMRNGRIIFTRLAQPIGDSNAEVVAGGIEQEMLSTIEYMKRLSFSPPSKLDIYIITSAGIKAAIDPTKFGANAVHMLTPYEVAGYLKIEGAAQPTDQFGDVVMASSVGLNKKHVLRLSVPQMRRIDQCYQLIAYQRLAITLVLLGMFGYMGYVGYSIYTLFNDNAALTQKRDGFQNDLDLLRQSIKESKLNVEKASDLIDLYQQIGKEKASPLPFLRKFEALSRAPVWVKSLEWSLTADAKSAKSGGIVSGDADQLYISAVVTLEFPQEASDPKSFRALTKKILADFREQFLGYEVNYSTQFENTKESEKLEIRSGQTEEARVQSLEAQMTIKGPLNPDIAKANKPQKPIIAVPTKTTP
jgi:hypothetical protein